MEINKLLKSDDEILQNDGLNFINIKKAKRIRKNAEIKRTK